jgi:adenine-specific DNA-methyltransferase
VSAKEEFYQLLDNMWSGGRTTSFNEGSGIQKLLGFRAKWYAENIRPQLKGMIDESLNELAGYEDEFYARAYGFLKKYINPKTGTIHFYDTSVSEGVSLSPFSAGDDTSLSWKTQDLYYIKKQQIPQPMAVPVGETGKHIHLEIGDINSYMTDGRDLIYVYNGATEAGISILMEATTKGKKTNVEKIAKAAKKEGIEMPIDVINRAINDFKSQTNVDFFINKDAGKFLHNRLNEESGAKLVSEIDHTDGNLIRRERFYRKVMGTIIDLCAQFEDELLLTGT